VFVAAIQSGYQLKSVCHLAVDLTPQFGVSDTGVGTLPDAARRTGGAGVSNTALKMDPKSGPPPGHATASLAKTVPEAEPVAANGSRRKRKQEGSGQQGAAGAGAAAVVQPDPAELAGAAGVAVKAGKASPEKPYASSNGMHGNASVPKFALAPSLSRKGAKEGPRGKEHKDRRKKDRHKPADG
jgi:hypothetical protein